ncbi:MAG: sarcosine oxidase subunit alpha family protein [Burkholderiaceae bacterium]|nr:sarcosine oxidase subunit alpha family protein [Burkholderiaceae bacterium]
MNKQAYRLSVGGRIDRARPLSFVFDGRTYTGFSGDTLASALLANGVHLVGRSMKYHRPRGIFSAGVEEPNALVTLRRGERREPNVPATTVDLYDGLWAESQNRWPSLDFDVLRAVDRFSSVFSAGFYYKTFMGPTRKAWRFYEDLIRKTAGLGEAPTGPDPDRYEKAHGFCDVLVVGAGPAGLTAAVAAGRAGARVLLVDDASQPGGSLLSHASRDRADSWLAQTLKAVEELPNVRVMPRTTVFGAYDNMVFGLLERVGDHLAVPDPHDVRQRLWVVRARQALYATGMIERPLVFGNNDLPGVMLASAARTYANRYAVLAGRKVVVFTNNDSAYEAAFDLAAAGASVAMVDPRREVPEALRRDIQRAGIELHPASAIAGASGRKRVHGVDLVDFDGSERTTSTVRARLACDLVLVSGGWTPTLQLLGQRGAKPAFDQARGMFVAQRVPSGYHLAGGAAGERSLARGVAGAHEAGNAAARACGFTAGSGDGPLLDGLPVERSSNADLPLTVIADPSNRAYRKKFVDLQHDVCVSDIAQALGEGYESVEHLKRYTTLGMATDQGKTSNVNALAIAAGILRRPIDAVGTTTFRPPFRPIPIGALAGSEFGRHFKPTRRSPMHDLHARDGAVFTATGLWLRPWYYPAAGEPIGIASVREAGRVRDGVGMVDISSLGKIDVQGLDCAEFLNRVYVNGWDTLEIGKARYGVMLRPDGIALDDGTTSRISQSHYFMTTTTVGAAKVMTFLEYLLQTAWPDLRVHVTSVTSQWAGIAVAGPRSRDVLARLVGDVDFDDASFPFMGVRHGHLGEAPVRLLRISFSGERAYEVYTPAGYGEAVWEAIRAAGKGDGMVVYGTEALSILRIEKGHVAGAEIEGRTTLADLGLGRMASRKKPFVGSTLARREGLSDAGRPQLVGLEPCQQGVALRAGSILCEPGEHRGHGIGFVSSVTFSPALGRNIAIGFVSGGMAREGKTVDAVFPLRNEVVPVRIASPHFVDPEGERLHA